MKSSKNQEFRGYFSKNFTWFSFPTTFILSKLIQNFPISSVTFKLWLELSNFILSNNLRGFWPSKHCFPMRLSFFFWKLSRLAETSFCLLVQRVQVHSGFLNYIQNQEKKWLRWAEISISSLLSTVATVWNVFMFCAPCVILWICF